MKERSEGKRTLYEVLGIKPSASQLEIVQAYHGLRAALGPRALEEVERAYATLCDPFLKRAYDQRLTEAPPPRRKGLLPGSALRMPLLAGAAAGLLLALWLSLWPFLRWRFGSYGPGEELVNRDGGKPYGVVLAHESRHAFPNGVVTAAYRLRLPSGEEVWLSREEVNQLAEPR